MNAMQAKEAMMKRLPVWHRSNELYKDDKDHGYERITGIVYRMADSGSERIAVSVELKDFHTNSVLVVDPENVKSINADYGK